MGLFRKKEKKALVKAEPKSVVTEETIMKYVKAFMPSSGLTENELMAFIEIARQFNLNPFKREIYCVPYGRGVDRKLSLITGYQVYLERAEATGLLEYWSVWYRDGKAGIVIKRKDRPVEFEWEIVVSEYDQQNSMWKKKRETMAKTVVIGQGFRMCFPTLLAGMPYLGEELPEKMATEETPEPQRISEKTIEVEAKVKELNGKIDEVLGEKLEDVEAVATVDPAVKSATMKDIIALVNELSEEHKDKKVLIMQKTAANKNNPATLGTIYRLTQEEDFDAIASL